MSRRQLIVALMLLVAPLSAHANDSSQAADSIRTYWITPIDVIARRVPIGEATVPLEKDGLGSVLSRNGFNLIRKGVFFAQDVYADGLKRGDLSVVVDGERYHSACPNRMDSPLTRVNPLDLAGIDMVKTSTNVQAGLGGFVNFRRRAPQDAWRVEGSVSGVAGASAAMDAATAMETHQQRVSLRFATGTPYDDGDGRSFADVYGYRDDFRYTLAEASLRGEHTLWNYGASFAYTEDVSFPYLLMDERENEVYNASVARFGHRLYFNYTDHRMDNQMRQSPMFMESIATNLTVGAVGSHVDAYYRNWKADNVMITPMATITNRMLADVHIGSVSVGHQVGLGDAVLSGRLGLNGQALGDDDRIAFNQALYPGAESDRLFVTYALATSYTRSVSKNVGAGVLVESVSEAPQTETLFMSVQKPMGKVWWAGNPTLDPAVRNSVRASIGYRWFQLEGFGSYVINYVELARATADGIRYMTYENVDALMTGLNARFDAEYVDVDASYVWAENQSADTPLSEIAPLRVQTSLTSPARWGAQVFATHTYSDAQTRVDENVGETATPSWNRVDLGVRYTRGIAELRLAVDNLTDEAYFRHLSYLRNPFASGSRVYEPGRTLRIGVWVSALP